MKNSLFYGLIIFLVLASFKFKNQNKSVEEAETLSISQTTDSLPPCFSSYQIFTETALFWQSAWVTYFNMRGGDYDDSPRVSFDKQNLNSLFDEVKGKEHPGILMWYTLLDPNDSIPSIAIQNTVACNIDPAGTILLASPNDTTSSVDTISQAYLGIIKKNWRDLGESNPAVYTDINGYNYEWDSIQNLMTLSPSLQQGLYIHYGLRTVEPDEAADYATSSDPDKTGSIIYCNIIYGKTYEINPTATLLDFAMPCPAYCGRN